jgi:hypothetical protein
MTDARTPDEQLAARRRLGPVTALAAGSLVGLVLGVGGIASAQTVETPAPSPSTSTAPEVQSQDDAADDAARDGLCDKEDAAGSDTADSTESSESADSAA